MSKTIRQKFPATNIVISMSYLDVLLVVFREGIIGTHNGLLFIQKLL